MADSSIPSLARRERERAATRQKILAAARRMLVQHGYEGTTMRAIARILFEDIALPSVPSIE